MPTPERCQPARLEVGCRGIRRPIWERSDNVRFVFLRSPQRSTHAPRICESPKPSSTFEMSSSCRTPRPELERGDICPNGPRKWMQIEPAFSSLVVFNIFVFQIHCLFFGLVVLLCLSLCLSCSPSPSLVSLLSGLYPGMHHSQSLCGPYPLVPSTSRGLPARSLVVGLNARTNRRRGLLILGGGGVA